jgi:hypothetical protein
VIDDGERYGFYATVLVVGCIFGAVVAAGGGVALAIAAAAKGAGAVVAAVAGTALTVGGLVTSGVITYNKQEKCDARSKELKEKILKLTEALQELKKSKQLIEEMRQKLKLEN